MNPHAWRHDELAHDLAECRRDNGEIAAERLGLGSWGGNEQLDVATMRTSWSTPRPTAYEVKISRADYLSDVRSAKYARYLPFVSRLFYATPAGLVDAKELPPGVGLIVRGPNGWNVRKAAPSHDPDPEKLRVLLMALLFKDQTAAWKPAGRAERIRLAGEGSLYDLSRKGCEAVRDALLAAKYAKETERDAEFARKILSEAMPDYGGWGGLCGYAQEAARRLGSWAYWQGKTA